MKKIINIRNITLILVVVLIGVLSLKTKEVKAAGTVTWSGASSVTIRETLNNVVNPIVAHREYDLVDENWDPITGSPTATINYTASDTYTNYKQTKTAVMNLSSLTFTDPGDYEYHIYEDSLYDSNDRDINYYFPMVEDPYYKVIVSVRNVVDGNNVPTGNFTASLILEECLWNDQAGKAGDYECSKVSPSSGVLYADYNYEAASYIFGYIELSKTVKGSGADRNKYFPFTITINNYVSQDIGLSLDSSGWTYPISGIDTTVTYNGSTISNPTSITDGTSTTIYLKHGQTAIIGQVTSGGSSFDTIPYGICSERDPGGVPGSYDFSKNPRVKKLANVDGLYCFGSYFTISENSDDYDASFSVNGGSSTSGYYVPATGIMDINTYSTTATVDFSNTKEMSPVTGLIFTILPYLILAGIGVGGTLLIMHLKRQKVDD